METKLPDFTWTKSDSILNMEFESRPIQEDISIVIPTLGRQILEQSLYWILTGNAWPGWLVVVEQGSNPDVARWLLRVEELGIGVRHILSAQRGRSAGINRGLEQVNTRFVAITDDDCFVDANWLLNMSNKLRHNPDAVVTGRIEAAGEEMITIVTSLEPAVYHRPRLKFDSMSGGNMGTSLTVFRKVGLFDEDPCMRTAEDAEWAYRALRSGVSILYDPDVCLWHYGWRDPEKRVELYQHYALSHGGFYGKYLRKGDMFIFFRAMTHFLRALRRWIRGRIRGDSEKALNGKAYFLWLLPGILAGLRSKQEAEKLA